MQWTPKKVSRVRRAAEEGLTALEIAEMLGEGCTKNMVISLAHRSRPKIKLKATAGDARDNTALKRLQATAAPTPATRLKFFIIEEIDGAVHQDALRANDRRCRMPLWPDRLGSKERPKPTEFFYCGKKTKHGSSWCEECRAKVFVPPKIQPVAPGKGRKIDDVGRRVGWQYGT